MKNILIALIALLVIGGGVYYFMSSSKTSVDNTLPPVPEDTAVEETKPTPFEVLPPSEKAEQEPVETIGTSVNGNDITAYHFGDGDTEVMFIGGIHGGYSFNTALVAFELIDYLESTPDAVPENVTVTVVPVMNPDGLKEIVGTTGRFDGSKVTANDAARVAGRFNGNTVDLNRNFDCEWDAVGTWQNKEVSGGSAPFSEPESAAIQTYVIDKEPAAIITWYSQAGGVYSSNCNSTVLPETNALTNLFADASGYGAFEEFDFYEITGDMVNWFAKMRIPAISVLLTNHEGTEWSKNKAGIDAVLEHYAE